MAVMSPKTPKPHGTIINRMNKLPRLVGPTISRTDTNTSDATPLFGQRAKSQMNLIVFSPSKMLSPRKQSKLFQKDLDFTNITNNEQKEWMNLTNAGENEFYKEIIAMNRLEEVLDASTSKFQTRNLAQTQNKVIQKSQNLLKKHEIRNQKPLIPSQ